MLEPARVQRTFGRYSFNYRLNFILTRQHDPLDILTNAVPIDYNYAIERFVQYLRQSGSMETSLAKAVLRFLDIDDNRMLRLDLPVGRPDTSRPGSSESDDSDEFQLPGRAASAPISGPSARVALAGRRGPRGYQNEEDENTERDRSPLRRPDSTLYVGDLFNWLIESIDVKLRFYLTYVEDRVVNVAEAHDGDEPAEAQDGDVPAVAHEPGIEHVTLIPLHEEKKRFLLGYLDRCQVPQLIYLGWFRPL